MAGEETGRAPVAVSRPYVDAGFAHVAVLPVGDDLDGFLTFWRDELRPALPD